jgi:hypothetical protein
MLRMPQVTCRRIEGRFAAMTDHNDLGKVRNTVFATMNASKVYSKYQPMENVVNYKFMTELKGTGLERR